VHGSDAVPSEARPSVRESRLWLRPFDESGSFQPDFGRHKILRLAVRGAGATMVAQVSGLAIRFAAVVVLARLLTPADFGLVAMVTSFSLLLLNFGSNGFTEAILQRDRIGHSLASNLFWINIGAGLLLAIGFAAAGSLLAWFYSNPLVAPIAVGISLTILITSCSVLHLALLARAMHYSQLSANNVVAQVAWVAISVLLAWAGLGYWALVAAAVAERVSLAVGAWSLCRWVPCRPRRVAGTGSMVRFAIHVYGRFSLNYFARNMDNLLVGWRFNAQSLGFYKKAYDLFALSAVVQSLTNVAVSALSRLRDDPHLYRQHLLTALSLVGFVGMGVGATLTLVGKDMIRLLLGTRWEPAGQIFTFFGPGVGMMFLYGTHGWIHLSIGTPDRWFRWGVVEFVVTALLFIVALPWGPVGIATTWSLSLWILTAPSLWYAGRPIGLGFGLVLNAVWKHVLASLLAGCATALIVGLPSFAVASDSIGTLTRIAITFCLFGVLYIAADVALHRSFTPLYQVNGILREMVPMFSKPSPTAATTYVTDMAEVLTLIDKR